MGAPATYENIKTISPAVRFSCRDATLTTDAILLNGFLEQDIDSVYAVKRPGLRVLADLTTFGLGLSSFRCQGQIAFGNAFEASTLSIMGDTVVQAHYGTTVTASVYPIPLAGATPGQQYRMLKLLEGLVTKAILQASDAIYTVWADGSYFTKIASPSAYPLLPSLCCLDSTYYVLDTSGTIWASSILNPAVWPALNFVVSPQIGGYPVTLVRHLNYLLAMGTQGITAYYDAAISPGAPIAQVMNAVFSGGITHFGAATVQEIDDTLYWLGTSTASGFIVCQMSGLTISKVSTPAVERVLEEYFVQADGDSFNLSLVTRPAAPRAFAVRVAGHSFYVLTSPTYTDVLGNVHAGITLVLDLTIGEWYQWSQFSGGLERELQPFSSSTTGSAMPMMLTDSTTGVLYTLATDCYQDNLQPIRFALQTDLYSWGNARMKLFAATYVQADTLPSSLTVSWTDNDYQSFSTPTVVSTSRTKKQLIRCGSSVQRAWRVEHSDNTRMRLYGLEVEVMPGAL